jgi:MFS family permease
MAGTYSRAEAAILPVFAWAHFSHHLAVGGLLPLLPVIRDEFALDYLLSGTLVSGFSLAYGFAQVPLAFLIDRYRLRKSLVIAIGLFGAALSSIAVGLSTSYGQMLVLLVLMGIFGSTYHALASSFLSEYFPADSRGRSLGLHVVGGSASFIATPALALGILNLSGSWRAAFIGLGLPAIVAGLLLLWLASGREKVMVGNRSPAARLPILDVVRLIGLLALIAAVMQVVTGGINTFLPLYLVDRHGVPREVAGIAVGLVAGAGIVGAPAGGMLSDRVGRKPVILLSVLLSGPLLYLITAAPHGVGLYLLIVLYGLVISMRMPTMESLIADVVPAAQRATVLSAYYFLANEVSGVATPLIGLLSDLTDLNTAFVVLAVFSILAGGLAALLRGGKAERTAGP